MADAVPEEVLSLAAERAARRAAGDFAEADALRDRILALGYTVTDGPEGPLFTPVEPPAAPADVTLLWVVQGWPTDTRRAIEAFRATNPDDLIVQECVVHATDEGIDYPDGAEVVPADPAAGWGAAQNAGLDAARGRVVITLDGSIEPTGDAVSPLVEVLQDPQVGLAGPFGIVTSDLRSFAESDGPRVDAVEAYCMAFRRELVDAGVRFDPRFRFYRSGDIEFSFRVAERGLARVVVPLPVRKHEHRMWHATPPEERDRLSKKNFYRFLDTYRGRFDLTEAGPPG